MYLSNSQIYVTVRGIESRDKQGTKKVGTIFLYTAGLIGLPWPATEADTLAGKGMFPAATVTPDVTLISLGK